MYKDSTHIDTKPHKKKVDWKRPRNQCVPVCAYTSGELAVLAASL